MAEKKSADVVSGKTGRVLVLVFTLLYIAAAGVFFFVTGVHEFTLYLAVLLALVGLVAWTLPRTKLPTWSLWLLSILGLLHALGGGVKVNGDVLYNYVLIPIMNNGVNGITLWRFDQLVHPYGTAVAALIVYFFIARHAKLPRLWMVVIAALVAMGLGALNEVIEFITKLTIQNTDVGGYNNTAIDLCTNMAGAIIGAAAAALKWGKKPPLDS